MVWDQRFKGAISGVGISRVTRSSETPLAALALDAVKKAVADSGLQMSDIDGLATFAELPASGHAVVDGLTMVSTNAMIAMTKKDMPNLRWHAQNETVNIGGTTQLAFNAVISGACNYVV